MRRLLLFAVLMMLPFHMKSIVERISPIPIDGIADSADPPGVAEAAEPLLGDFFASGGPEPISGRELGPDPRTPSADRRGRGAQDYA